MKYRDARATAEAHRPITVIDVPPSVWAQTWTERPTGIAMIGLRSLSETALTEIIGAACTRADRLMPGGDAADPIWAAEYNRVVVALAVGRALCEPECVDVPWWSLPDLVALERLTGPGAQWLYARLEAAMVASSPLASDEEPGELYTALGAALARGVAHLSPARRSQVARHLRAALDVLADSSIAGGR